MRLLRPILMGLAINITSQPVTLEYIFQEPQIINPRPSLKQINPYSNKLYYYADDDYDGRLNMYDYNYLSGETYKYLDTGETASEFVILKNGDCLAIIGGDLFISKKFTSSRTFAKDIQLNSSDDYEYSPLIRGNNVIYRRKGNYYMTRFDTTGKKYNEVDAAPKQPPKPFRGFPARGAMPTGCLSPVPAGGGINQADVKKQE